jgi:predicted nucleotidyltransferase
MDVNGIHFDERQIGAFCERHQVQRLALFGSILGDQFRPDSDVDMLVEFRPHAKVSLFDLGGMITELQGMLDRDVDLRTPRDLSKYFRDEVLRAARDVYVA